MLDLYNTLEELRYPEVAQINFEEFEISILTGSKRIELLNWVLQDNQDVLNKFKEPTLEGKLLKCYSQMGFCSKEDVLLGSCKIEEQLDFLSLLTLLIRNTYSVKIESLKNDKENANNLLKAEIKNKSPNIKCTDVDTNKNETILPSNSESLEITENLIEKQRSDFETMFSDMKANLEEANKYQIDNYESTLQEFDKSFQNVTSIPIENLPSNKLNNYENLDTHIEKMHSTFSSINKALINQVEFKNRVIPENSEKKVNPLSSIIRDTVVIVEQACNMLEEDQLDSSKDEIPRNL